MALLGLLLNPAHHLLARHHATSHGSHVRSLLQLQGSKATKLSLLSTPWPLACLRLRQHLREVLLTGRIHRSP
jgi:hypothetical protein